MVISDERFSNKSLAKKLKSGVKNFMQEKIEFCKEFITGYEKKIVLGTFIVFIGSGLVASGVVEKYLNK